MLWSRIHCPAKPCYTRTSLIRHKWTDDHDCQNNNYIMMHCTSSSLLLLLKSVHSPPSTLHQSTSISQSLVISVSPEVSTMSYMYITATGRGLKVGKAHDFNTFMITMNGNVVGSMCLHLSIEMDGPGHAEIWTNDLGDGRIEVTYQAEEPGVYKLNITYQGKPIKGSPFKLNIR